MTVLVTLLESLDAKRVKTYIQSGNVVFLHTTQHPFQLSEKIANGVMRQCGFAPPVILLSLKALEQSVQRNPYPAAEVDPKTLHLYFLHSIPENPDLRSLDSIKKDNERYTLIDNVFYLHVPDGIGRSKVAASVEKALGVAATARNWRTVCKLTALGRDISR